MGVFRIALVILGKKEQEYSAECFTTMQIFGTFCRQFCRISEYSAELGNVLPNQETFGRIKEHSVESRNII